MFFSLCSLVRFEDLMGSAALDQDQAFDLDVIKRKYMNMMNMITYDDLPRRLENIIASLRHRAQAN